MKRRIKFVCLLLTILSLSAFPLSAQIITNNLLLWFKAGAGVTVDGSGTNVTQWADQSGNGYLAQQAALTPGVQPDLVTNAIHGQPALHFNGAASGDHLFITNNTVNLSSGLSIFIIAQNNVRKDYNGLFKLYHTAVPGGASSDLEIYWQAGTAGSGNIYYVANRDTYPGVYGDVGGFNQPPNAGNPYLYDIRAVSSSATQRVNGATAGAPSGNTFVPTNTADKAVIGYGFSAYPIDGYIAEVIVYNTALSQTQRDGVWAYLEGKYSLGIPEPSTVAFLAMGGSLLERRSAQNEMCPNRVHIEHGQILFLLVPA